MVVVTALEYEAGRIITTSICDQDLEWHYDVRLMILATATFEDYRNYCQEVQALGSILDLPGQMYYEVSVD